MDLRQILNVLRKIFTFRQFAEVSELMHDAALMSKERTNEQEVRVIFRNGHPHSYKISVSSKPSLAAEYAGDESFGWDNETRNYELT